MLKILWLISGIIMLANFAVFMVYRGIVVSSHLFVTSNTVLYPLAVLNLVIGTLCLFTFVRLTWFNRRKAK
jgi:hypothetical protein